MYRKPNYVLAGAKYGIGIAPEVKKAEAEQVEAAIAEVKREGASTGLLIGAGAGYLFSGSVVGAAIGAGIGYFLPNLRKVVTTAETVTELPPEKPFVEREESF